jgi:RNA polymerase sigma factor (sigma-70 family)
MSADSPLDVATILRNAKEGNPEALGPVFAKMRDSLKGVAYSFIPVRWEHQIWPSDVVQDCFLLALEHFGDFRGKTEVELYSWMAAIVRSVVGATTRHLLAAKRRATLAVAFDDDVHSSQAKSQAAPNPLAEAITREERRLMANMLKLLPKETQRILHWQWNKYSVGQIAGELGISVAAAYKWIARAEVMFYQGVLAITGTKAELIASFAESSGE